MSCSLAVSSALSCSQTASSALLDVQPCVHLLLLILLISKKSHLHIFEYPCFFFGTKFFFFFFFGKKKKKILIHALFSCNFYSDMRICK
jgi:hypothetical protein